MGKGCSMLQDWPAFAEWLEAHKAVIKRADVAYDDMDGKLVSIAWAVDQYRGEAITRRTFSPTRETQSSRSTPRHGVMRCCGLRFTIFGGMTSGTPLRRGTARPGRQRMNCSGWAGGKPNPWWSAMRMLRRRAYRLQRTG